MLERFFSPRAIAVIGASSHTGKLGNSIVRNIIRYGWHGKVVPVNVHGGVIEGIPVVKNLREIRHSIDVAIVVIPADGVLSALRVCGQKRIPFVVVISAGFRERGIEGARREQQMMRIAKKYHMRILGPNCLGFLNTYARLNASFADGMPSSGGVALVSQSGAMGVAMMDWAYGSGVGFSKIISIGNKADIHETECLSYLANDRSTRVILLYLESITDGKKFIETARRISPYKPIIVLKAGRNSSVAHAVQSHTGALTGSEEALSAAFRAAGIIRATTIEEFFDMAAGFSMQPKPLGNRIAIITNAGGPGIMAIDALTNTRLQLAHLNYSTQQKIAKRLPEAASCDNPIDVLGDALADRYDHTLRYVLQSPSVDMALVILTPQTMTDEVGTARAIGRWQNATSKPVFASFIGSSGVRGGRTQLEREGIPQFDTPERAIRLFDRYVEYATHERLVTPKVTRRRCLLPSAEQHSQIRISEAEKIAKSVGLSVVESHLLQKISDMNEIFSWPIVMKIASRDVIHKADVDAVVRHIRSVSMAKQAWKRIVRNVHHHVPHAEIEGMFWQPEITSGIEVMVGLRRDPVVGLLILVGLGGHLVEILHDVAIGCAPIDARGAHVLLRMLRSFPLLHKHERQLTDILVRVSRLGVWYADIAELDLNPIILHDDCTYSIVDIRIIPKTAS